MKFVLNGSAVTNFSNEQKAMKVIQSLGPGELLTTSELAMKAGVSTSDGSLRGARMLPFRYRLLGNKLVWGRIETIKQLKKELNDNC